MPGVLQPPPHSTRMLSSLLLFRSPFQLRHRLKTGGSVEYPGFSTTAAWSLAEQGKGVTHRWIIREGSLGWGLGIPEGRKSAYLFPSLSGPCSRGECLQPSRPLSHPSCRAAPERRRNDGSSAMWELEGSWKGAGREGFSLVLGTYGIILVGNGCPLHQARDDLGREELLALAGHRHHTVLWKQGQGPLSRAGLGMQLCHCPAVGTLPKCDLGMPLSFSSSIRCPGL